MSFVIEESFVKGKSLTGLCEDGWVATPDYVVVIDGATSKSDYRIDGVTTGRKAMEIISDEVQRLPSGISASEFVNIINERIIRYYKTNHMRSACPSQRTRRQGPQKFPVRELPAENTPGASPHTEAQTQPEPAALRPCRRPP